MQRQPVLERRETLGQMLTGRAPILVVLRLVVKVLFGEPAGLPAR